MIKDRYRIAKIFNFYFMNAQGCYVVFGKKQIPIKIIKLESESFVIRILDFDRVDRETLTLRFDGRHGYYIAECSVEHVREDNIQLAMPHYLDERKEREHKRIQNVSNVSLTLKVLPILEQDFSIYRSELASVLSTNHFVKLLKQDILDATKIIQTVTQNLQKLTDRVEIQFYKSTDTIPKRVHVVKTCRKTLYIANVSEQASYLHVHKEAELISVLPMLHKLREQKCQDTVVRSYLQQIMKEDAVLSARSYVCAPLFLYPDFVGTLFVASDDRYRSFRFREVDIKYIQGAAALISEVLWQNKIQALSEGDWQGKVLDLSSRGMAIQIPAKLLQFLSMGVRLTISCELPPYTLFCLAEIVRLVPESSSFCVEFKNLSFDAQEKINNFIARHSS